jgi:glycosyltransferase domain-containing protein
MTNSDVYTLLVPTYNRSDLLATLLRYLERQGVSFPVLVLDSSKVEHRARNQRLISSLSLRVEHVEYDVSMPPFDKFREGIAKVQTPLCGLCADDDLVVVDGVSRCVTYLGEHPDVCVAHGYCFTFLNGPERTQDMDLTGVLYYTPSLDAEDPLWRLRHLFRNYQALTYATYRTFVLRDVFEAVRPVESMLARELLSGALSVVQGKAARLPYFTNGRSMAASVPYTHWHPLEWLTSWPRGLFAEYGRYRDILVTELMAADGHRRSRQETERIVDLVHMFYLVRHTPLEAFDFIMDNVLNGVEDRTFWPAMEIQLPLIHASRYLPPPGAGRPEQPRRTRELLPRLKERLRRLIASIAQRPARKASPRTVRTAARLYRLHEAVVRPQHGELIRVGEDDVQRLLGVLDQYRREDAP